MEKQTLNEGAVDLFLIYSFIKRLTTPWDKTEAFELGLIDSDGKKIKKAKTNEEKAAMGLFDKLVFNLKRLLEKIPGGKSRIATYAAALLLIRESEEMSLNPDNMTEISESLEANMHFLKGNGGKDLKVIREEIANIVGAGQVAGVAPGEDPPVGRKRKKRKKKPILRRSFKDFDVPIKEAAGERDAVIKDFGKILFGGFRNKKEPDTNKEIKVFDQLTDFVSGNVRVQSKRLIEPLKRLNKNKALYKDILVPDDSTIYRGTRLSIGEVLALNIKSGKKQKGWSVIGNLTYSARSPIQSWASTAKIAKDFADGKAGVSAWTSGAVISFFNEIGDRWTEKGLPKPSWAKKEFKEKGIPVLMIYKSKPSEVIFNHKFMNKISREEIGKNEDEVLRIDQKPIKVTALIPSDTLSIILKNDPAKREKPIQTKLPKGVSLEDPFIMQEDVSASQLRDVEKFADSLGAKFKIDVQFSKHFGERVNDKRNKKPITVEELTRFFRKTMKKYGGKIKMMGDQAEAVLNDLLTDINLPFVVRWDDRKNEWDFIAKTIMRKKNFKTPGKKLRFEEFIQETTTIKFQSVARKGLMDKVAHADSADLLKDLFMDDEFGIEVLWDIRNKGRGNRPPTLGQLKSVKKQLQAATQKALSGFPNEMKVYRIGALRGAEPISFTVDPKFSGHSLPWVDRTGAKGLEEYTVKKKDILVAPNAILRAGKGTEGEDEVVIPGNKVKLTKVVSELAVKIPKKKDTLGIPRNKMPQIVSKDYPEFFKYLEDKGVSFKKERVAADTLKAVQSDFSREGVIQSMMKTLAGAKEKAVIASTNGFIIDGHHRWLVALNTNPKKKIAIIRASVPVNKLLELTLKFPKIHFRSITDSFDKGAK